MTKWILLLIAAAIILALCLLRIGVIFQAEDGRIRLWLRCGFLRIGVIPGKKKQKKKKNKKGKKKKKKKPDGKKTGKKDLLKKGKQMVPLFLDLLELAKKAGIKFLRALRLEELSFCLIWSEPDPADAAIHYGQLWALWGTLESWLENTCPPVRKQTSIQLDFEPERPSGTAKLSCSVTLFQILTIFIPTVMHALMLLWRNRKRIIPKTSAKSKGEQKNGTESSPE